MKTELYPTKENAMPQYKLFVFIYLSLFGFLGCQPKDKFEWNAGMSAPKFYGNGGPYVSFYYQGKSVAGASASIGFDPGWGEISGGYSGGERFKPIPDSVYVRWICAADRYSYEGGAKLPRERMLELFRTPIVDAWGYNSPYSLIIAGFAPGGNVSVWMRGGVLTEIIKFKAENKGIWLENDPDYNRLEEEIITFKEFINSEANVFRYLHGIPYNLWEKGEEAYDWDTGFTTEEKEKSNYNFSLTFYAQDGTVVYGESAQRNEEITSWEQPYGQLNNNWIKEAKLPVHLMMTWRSPDDQQWYRAQIVLPLDFKKRFSTPYINPEIGKKTQYNRIVVGMEKELSGGEAYTFGRIWLDGPGKQEQVMRFRAAKLDVTSREFSISLYSRPSKTI